MNVVALVVLAFLLGYCIARIGEYMRRFRALQRIKDSGSLPGPIPQFLEGVLWYDRQMKG